MLVKKKLLHACTVVFVPKWTVFQPDLDLDLDLASSNIHVDALSHTLMWLLLVEGHCLYLFPYESHSLSFFLELCLSSLSLADLFSLIPETPSTVFAVICADGGPSVSNDKASVVFILWVYSLSLVVLLLPWLLRLLPVIHYCLLLWTMATSNVAAPVCCTLRMLVTVSFVQNSTFYGHYSYC